MYFALNDIKKTGRIKRVKKQQSSVNDMASIRSFQEKLLSSNPRIKAIVNRLIKSA